MDGQIKQNAIQKEAIQQEAIQQEEYKKDDLDSWDSDSTLEDNDGCDNFPKNVLLGRNIPLIKDDNDGILRTDSFCEYLEQVEDFEDLRSMWISMILNLKERIKGCENCDTCNQVIQILDMNIHLYKKISKLAHHIANIFMYIVNKNIPTKLNEQNKNLLNVAFILLIKNSKFKDIQIIYEKFKTFINVDAFDGLILCLAIQKYSPQHIRIMLKEWGCNPIIREHRPIIRAFYYEKFGIIRSLIENGSSYKYYFQEELTPAEYKTFQKVIDKYLHQQYPTATDKEKELIIVDMINDYRHIQLEDGIEQPIAYEFFVEEFEQYFYIKTGFNPATSDKKKKRKKKKQKNKESTLESLDLNNEQLENTENYDLMNDETFNNMEIFEESNTETILLDSYYTTNKILYEAPKNQTYLGHLEDWKPILDINFNNRHPKDWLIHFHNILYQYSYF